MDEHIECRNCDSPDCKGCNIKTLETMLKSGKLDCLMNANRSINPSADVSLVRHGRWVNNNDDYPECNQCGYMPQYDPAIDDIFYSPYCPVCGCNMDLEE